MDSRPGTYVLLLAAARRHDIRVGRLGRLTVRPGYYVYVGSAFGPGGVLARVRHHRRPGRAPRWHVDYLRAVTRLREVWFSHDPDRQEHRWAGIFGTTRGSAVPLRRFGASDCRCESHLFFFEAPPSFAAFRRQAPSARRAASLAGGPQRNDPEVPRRLPAARRATTRERPPSVRADRRHRAQR